MRYVFTFLIIAFSVINQAKADIGIDPDTLTEVGAYSNEWCTENKSEKSEIEIVCVGRAQVHERSVRAVAVIDHSKEKSLFIELDPAPVEMLKPQFAVVGPVVRRGTSSTRAPEIGEVDLQFDRQGESISVRIWTPSLGHAQAFR